MKMRKIDFARYIETSQDTKGNEESKKTRLKHVMSEACKIQYNIVRMTRILFLTVNRCLKTLGICASCSDCCSNPHNVKVQGENRYFSVLANKSQEIINQINEFIDKGIEGEVQRRLNSDIGIDIVESYNEKQIQYFRLCIKTFENTQKIITERENIVVDVLRKDTMLPLDTINIINDFVGCPSTSRVTG
jgi:glucokinase